MDFVADRLKFVLPRRTFALALFQHQQNQRHQQGIISTHTIVLLNPKVDRNCPINIRKNPRSVSCSLALRSDLPCWLNDCKVKNLIE